MQTAEFHTPCTKWSETNMNGERAGPSGEQSNAEQRPAMLRLNYIERKLMMRQQFVIRFVCLINLLKALILYNYF